VEEFAKDIEDSTKRENVWAKIIQAELIEKGYKVELKDNGVDNTGKLIKKSNKNMSKLDNILVINGTEVPMDIKTNDRGMDYDKISCMTIKLTSMREAIAVDGRLIVVDRDYWIIFRKDVLRRMIEEIQPAVYYEFSPNDLCIRIYNKSFSNFLSFEKKVDGKAEVRRWGKEASIIIKENEDKLFRKKEKK